MSSTQLNEIRFKRNAGSKPTLQINEGKGWQHFKSSSLLSTAEWQAFKNIRAKDAIKYDESLMIIQYGIKHGYAIIPAEKV